MLQIYFRQNQKIGFTQVKPTNCRNEVLGDVMSKPQKLETPRVFQILGVCGQAFSFLPSPAPSPSPSPTSFALAPIFARPKSEKCFERTKNPGLTETLETQARVSIMSTSMSHASFSLSGSPKSTLQTAVQVLAFVKVHDATQQLIAPSVLTL